MMGPGMMAPGAAPGMMPGMMPQGRAMPGMGYGGPAQGAMHPMAQLFKQMNLSPEQLEQIKEITTASRAQGVERMKSLGELFGQLKAAFAAPAPDSAAIGDLYRQIFDLQRESIVGGIEAYNNQVGVLNDEQRTLWNGMRERMLQASGWVPGAAGTN
jgi:Spy/CpxP family protein refolding chaperone